MSFSFSLPLIADGTGSCGELTGGDPDNVCCENTVLKNRDILYDRKKKAVLSGADMLLAPTGGIMHTRLEDQGYDESFADFNEELVRLTKECADKLPAAGVLYENIRMKEEYGRNAFESAFFDHLEKITVLKDAGADLIIVKDFEKLWDMRAAVLAAKNADMPVFVVIQTDDEGCTEGGADYIAALITLQSIGADAFGIECTAGADELARLIKKAFPHAEIPLIAAADISACSMDQLRTLAENGASVYIDLSAEPDAEKLKAVKCFGSRFEQGGEKDSYAAANYREAFFLPENLTLSEPVECGYDLSEDLIDLDDTSANAVYFRLESTDDAASIAENAAMSYLPFVIHADDPTTLEAALRYYQGRLIVDTQCDIEKDELTSLTEKYGAILY